MTPLPLSFYQRRTKTVALELLGQKLCHLQKGKLTSGLIIETEAYLGLKDPACHSFHGKRTPRVQSLYKIGGHAYIYLIYGMHLCFNVVTENEQHPEAVLIRALFPQDGVEMMKRRRGIRDETNLCSGPGKLCQALDLKREQDGLTLLGPELWIEAHTPFAKIKRHVTKGPRVGIDYAKEAKDWPLRFRILPEFLLKRVDI